MSPRCRNFCPGRTNCLRCGLRACGGHDETMWTTNLRRHEPDLKAAQNMNQIDTRTGVSTELPGAITTNHHTLGTPGRLPRTFSDLNFKSEQCFYTFRLKHHMGQTGVSKNGPWCFSWVQECTLSSFKPMVSANALFQDFRSMLC